MFPLGIEELPVTRIQRDGQVTADILVGDDLPLKARDKTFALHAAALELKRSGGTFPQLPAGDDALANHGRIKRAPVRRRKDFVLSRAGLCFNPFAA